MPTAREEALALASRIVNDPEKPVSQTDVLLMALQFHFEARRASALRMMAKAMATMLAELLDRVGFDDLPTMKHAKETVAKLSASLAIEETQGNG